MLEKPVGLRDEFSLDCVTVMPVGCYCSLAHSHMSALWRYIYTGILVKRDFVLSINSQS